MVYESLYVEGSQNEGEMENLRDLKFLNEEMKPKIEIYAKR